MPAFLSEVKIMLTDLPVFLEMLLTTMPQGWPFLMPVLNDVVNGEENLLVISRISWRKKSLRHEACDTSEKCGVSIASRPKSSRRQPPKPCGKDRQEGPIASGECQDWQAFPLSGVGPYAITKAHAQSPR